MGAVKQLSSIDMNNLPIRGVQDPTNAQDASTKAYTDTAGTAARSRANHTGSQLASTISDFDTAVRTTKLNQLAAPDTAVALNNQKITGLADPTNLQDAATKNYVDAQMAAAATGLAFKGAVRAASSANISVTSAPATIDGVTPTAGDVFLLTAQTTGSENGPWTWNGAGSAMTRPTNWNSNAKAVPGSLWVIQQGTRDNFLAILSNDSFTLGTTTGTFVYLNPGAAADNDTAYVVTCPTQAAGAAWAINHNLGSQEVDVTIRRTASPFDIVTVQVTCDTANQVNVRPDVGLTAGEYTARVTLVAA